MCILKLSRKLPILSFLRNPNYNYTPNPFPPPHQNLHSQFGASLLLSNRNGRALKYPIPPRNYGVVDDKILYKWFRRLMAVVFGMLGLTYASPPLYRTFCSWTGQFGTVQISETVEEKIVRHDQDGTAPTREIIVQFNADVADGMQWKFISTQREVRVKPGECALAFYTVENQSSSPITGVSRYNVTPDKAGQYFNKIQCFCFEKQCLLPGERIDMPVLFFIDPEIETDRLLNGVNNII